MKSKKLPRSVIAYLLLLGFSVGTILAGIPLVIIPIFGRGSLTGVLIWILTITVAILGNYIIQLKYKETIYAWLPFLEEKKKK